MHSLILDSIQKTKFKIQFNLKKNCFQKKFKKLEFYIIFIHVKSKQLCKINKQKLKIQSILNFFAR